MSLDAEQVLALPDVVAIFEILVLDGVSHEFPMPDNNPHKFSGPKEFWKFFHDHAKK